MLAFSFVHKLGVHLLQNVPPDATFSTLLLQVGIQHCTVHARSCRFGYPWHESFVYAWARTALFPDRSPPRLSKHLTHFFLSPGHTSYELGQCRVMILSGTYLFCPSNLFDAKILCNNFESRRSRIRKMSLTSQHNWWKVIWTWLDRSASPDMEECLKMHINALAMYLTVGISWPQQTEPVAQWPVSEEYTPRQIRIHRSKKSCVRVMLYRA